MLTADLLELSDTEVQSLVRSPLTKQWDLSLERLRGPLGSITAHRITPTLLAKVFSASEVATLKLLRKHTTIPVPQPRYDHIQRYLVMDFVEGKMLIDCWSSLSFFMKLRVACTLRGYLGQLRRLRGVVPGRLEDGIVSGIQFEEVELGPFKSATDFRLYCELIAQFSWNETVKYRKPAEPLPPPLVLGDDWDLVLTHGDLNLTNLLLAEDGVLWVIDWGNSGYYPKWMESVTMRHDVHPKTWNDLRWLISGSFPTYEVFWEYVEQRVERFRR
ncbi:hypothetical protein C0993_006331 [Termitomyces sp. T159_Od127]|nr:hypothetical protein C0993_006331 [Termitomyces sp. T159_Od127]